MAILYASATLTSCTLTALLLRVMDIRNSRDKMSGIKRHGEIGNTQIISHSGVNKVFKTLEVAIAEVPAVKMKFNHSDF